MSTRDFSSSLEDERQIVNLLVRWGHARDSDDWETLAGCFHDDATIHISWISGSAKDYIARSRVMAAARKSGEHAKHLISGPWIQVNEDRALTRCHANLYVRTTIKGQECDLQSWIRFFDLLKKKDSAWRIVKRTAVYEKDRLEPVDPRGVPKDFFDDMKLSAFPASAKFLSYWQLCSGRLASTNIISVYSEEERMLTKEGERWLEAS
jgi:3-phenylpropionate/cinnamic acid dioxygenase small subunit